MQVNTAPLLKYTGYSLAIAVAYFGLFSIAWPNISFIRSIVPILFVLTLFSLRFIKPLLGRLPKKEPTKKTEYLFLGAIFVFSLYVALSLQQLPESTQADFGIIYKQAVNMTSGLTTYDDYTSYLNAYPNNIGTTMLLAFWFNFWSYIGLKSTAFLTIFLNVLFLNGTVWLLYGILKKLFRFPVIIMGTTLGALFLSFSLWSSIYYSDTIGVIFPTALLYIYLIYPDSRHKTQLIILSGLIIGAGLTVKPLTIFVASSIGFLQLYHLFHSSKYANLAKAKNIFIIGVFCVISYITPNALARMSLDIHPDPTPPTHFIMIGLSTRCSLTQEYCYYGSWNPDDNSIYGRFFYPDRAAYKQFLKEEIVDRIRAMGIIKYLNFLSHKGAWSIGDGTFFAMTSLGNDPAYTNVKARSNMLFKGPQRILQLQGKRVKVMAAIYQIMWFFVLCLSVLSCIRLYNKQVIAIVTLTLLQTIAFLLVFEGGPRYLFIYIPFFIIMACAGASSLRLPSVIDRLLYKLAQRKQIINRLRVG